MYCNFFGLQTNPFSPTPDPTFLFLSLGHKQALGSIIYGVTEKKGFISVTGQVGLGKTTILRSYLDQIDQAQQHAIYLLNPNVSFSGLLKMLLLELGHQPIQGDEAEIVEQLHLVLIQEYQKGQTVVLLIDEAQNMPVATLEQLRMLSNLETPKDKLIQIVVLGQPEFDVLLDRYELRQIRQRIALRATIQPLSHAESVQYIRHRLDKAGGEGKAIFTNSALKRIVREAKGIPRSLNILCDNALVTALGYKKNPVTARIAQEVINDLSGKPSHAFWKLIPLAAGALILGLALIALMPLTDSNLPDTSPLQEIEQRLEEGNRQNHELSNVVTVDKHSEEDSELLLKKFSMVSEESEPILKDSLDMFTVQPIAEDSSSPIAQAVKNVTQKSEIQRKSENISQITATNSIAIATNGEDLEPPVQMAKKVVLELEELPKPDIIAAVKSVSNIAISTNAKHLEPPVQMAKNVVEKLEALPKPNMIPQVILEQNVASSSESSSKQFNEATSSSTVTKIMKEGDTLAGLMMDVYGSRGPSTLRFVLKHNRHIVNVRKIFPGQQVRFPPLPKMNEKARTVSDAPMLVSHTGKKLKSSKTIFAESALPRKSKQKKHSRKRKQPYAVAIVQKGDTLEKLAKLVYGSSDPLYVQRVVDFNPKIMSPKKIFPGQEIIFPKLTNEEKVLTR